MCSRDEIIHALSTEERPLNETALDMLISRLRMKLESVTHNPYSIATVFKGGYRLDLWSQTNGAIDDQDNNPSSKNPTYFRDHDNTIFAINS
jgi:DNA-binding winged helix-turn-helix (wHTH) protein